jgi:hypothetical protein
LFITVCHEKLDLQLATLLGFAAAQLNFLVADLLHCWVQLDFPIVGYTSHSEDVVEQ